MLGIIYRNEVGNLVIRVDGYERRIYFGYTKRAVIREYRWAFGLVGRKIHWEEDV